MTQANFTVRVALVGYTGLLGDIVRQAIKEAPDLVLVEQLTTPGPDLDLLPVDADFILWNEADETRIAEWLKGLTHRHSPRVLATLSDGQQAALWELTPHRIELGALSPATLVDTIRGSWADQP